MARKYILEVIVKEGYDEFWEDVNRAPNPSDFVVEEVKDMLNYVGLDAKVNFISVEEDDGQKSFI